MKPPRCFAILESSVLILSLAACASARAENWPRFRGPNGTGIALNQNIPMQWSGTKNVLWKTALPGRGNSSPIIWGDRIFLQTAPDDKERQMICLNAANGAIRWQTTIAGGRARTHKKNSLASSTPATDGERVYGLFWDGDKVAVHAFDFAGKHLWKKELGSFLSQHGPGASPIVCDGKVILNNDQDKYKDDAEQRSGFPGRTSRLIALDARTGDLAWEAPRTTYRACYSTPFVHKRGDGSDEIIVASTAGITGYDPKTGADKWHWTWSFSKSPLRTVGSPIFADGMVFASSGDGSGERHMVAIRKGDKGDVTKTNLTWETRKTIAPYVPSLLYWGDHIYFVNDQGMAVCLEAKTGAAVWSERLRGAMSASPILVDGKIYAISEDGDAYVFAAAPAFKLLAQNSIGEGVIATPAVADGRLYVRGTKHLFCIGAKTDK